MIKFVGLDIETSGTNVNKHQLIQIGIALGVSNIGNDSVFVSDVGYPENELIMDPDATKIHKFTKDRILTAPPVLQVDETIVTWLEKLNIAPHSLIAVGWNVAGFDIPFVRKFLPKTSKFFSYRTVDLNALCFTMSGPNKGYDRIKKTAKKYSTDLLGFENWHDAGFDAVAGLLTFYWFKQKLELVFP